MKTILDLIKTELKVFFLKEENYVNFDHPLYFSFECIRTILEVMLKPGCHMIN